MKIIESLCNLFNSSFENVLEKVSLLILLLMPWFAHVPPAFLVLMMLVF